MGALLLFGLEEVLGPVWVNSGRRERIVVTNTDARMA
jgi:hypothetical protein